MILRCSLRVWLAALLMGLSTACHADDSAQKHETAERPEVGLMGTIPIYWGEAGDFGETLSGGSETHWARAQLEVDYSLRPLDTLSEESLAGLRYLLLAQPRAFSPAENVALDEWVRDGGRLLLFADPMMTGESRFAIGDRRRPQDVILLSPILARWGLELTFDDAAPHEYVLVPAEGGSIPVRLAGSWIKRDGEAECSLTGRDVVAQCVVGRGRALIVADAALLDLHEPHSGAPAALGLLLASAFQAR